MPDERDRDELNDKDPQPGEEVRGLEDEDEGEDEDLEDETDGDESTA